MSLYERLVERVEGWIPRGVSEDAHRRLSFAVWFSLSGGLFLALFSVVNLASNPTAALALGAFVPLMLLVPLLTRYAPRPSLGAHLFIANTLVVLTAAAAAKGGLASSPAGWLPASSFVMVLVLGTRGALPWILGVVVAHGVLGYQSSQAGWPEELGPVAVFIASRVGATVFSMWLASVFESARLRAHDRLETRRAETRQLLDHADQGFLSIDATGALGGECSAVVERWLGERPAEGGLVAWAAQADPAFAAWLELGLASLQDGVFSEEVNLAQLPQALEAGGRALSMEVRPMARAGRYLVILTDRSEALARQAAEEAERETARLVQLLATDRAGVTLFVDELDGLVADLEGELPRVIALRHLHTIKGNCGLFGLTSLAQLVHAVEDRCAETGEGPTRSDLDAVSTKWHRIIDRVRSFLGSGDHVHVRATDLDQLQLAVAEHRAYDEIEAIVASLREEPAGHALERMADATTELADRLGRVVDVVCEGGAVRLPPRRWAPLFAVIPHLVRNAVDHGLESPADREAAGKPVVGVLRLGVELSADGQVEISVTDDGRGIDWAAVEAAAAHAGIPHSTHPERVAALFCDGLTTKHVVTEVSGRGAGSAAVRQVVDELGGVIEVHSVEGQGTRFVCRAPLYAAVSHAAK